MSDAGFSRAIVTGGAGFVGSHLVDRLLAEGVSVLVVDDLSTGRVSNIPATAQFERLDISGDALTDRFRAWGPEVVFHLAAQTSVPLSTQDPLRDLAVNVVGTHRVVDAARRTGVRRIVFVSSGGAVYGEADRPATELTRPVPTSYYGVHKLAAEGHIAIAGVPYAIARPSNIYGPRQITGVDGAVVAGFVDQAMTLGRLQIHGDGSQTRDFIDVRDIVSALLRLGRTDTPAGIWNVSSGRRVAITALADLVERELGRSLERTFASRRIGDVTHSSVSAARLRALGWRPTRGLAAGVNELLRLHDHRKATSEG